jgi:serine/threonine-protein kinase
LVDLIKGKYRIVREIARSNDIVYEAQDTALGGRRIALKELNFPPNLTGQARRERIERFNREARAAGRLSHPNIVTIYEFWEENGRYFIAMEYLDGQTLRDVMQARGALPLRDAVDIACQMLSALGYAHANRVIHRDVKPDNIFILQGGQVKLTDFGIARLTEEASLTSDGQVFGTPSYMSPEQIEGRGIDYRSDLFSLAVVLYEMLLGRKPFTGDSVVSITYAVMNAEPPNMMGVPMGIEQVVRRALSKSPAQRQSSAEQMLQDLRNAEQTPAVFFAPGAPAVGQTGMGTPGGGYGGSGAYSGNTGYGTGYGANGGYGTGYTGYGTPPIAPYPTGSTPAPLPSATNGLPWAWNSPGGPPQPGPATGTYSSTAPPLPTGAGVPAPTYGPGGPVPTFGAGGPLTGAGGVFPYSSPPFPARPPEPLLVLSPNAKRWLLALVAAISIGTIAAFGVIAFMNKYAEFEENARNQQVMTRIQKAETAYNAGDYAGAAKQFEQTLKAGVPATYRPRIETELGYTYVFLARAARSAGDTATARADYETALSYSPNYNVAHTELALLLESLGDPTGAQVQRNLVVGGDQPTSVPPKLDSNTITLPTTSNSSGGGSSTLDGSGQNPDQFIQDRREQARQLIREGDQLDLQGDHDGATAKWTEAVSKGAGFSESDEARTRLNQSNPSQ